MIPPQANSGLVAAMEQVLDVYKRPYDGEHPVICMDESPKQSISDARPGVPMAPGRTARTDYEYVRHGMVNIFMANEPLRGNRMVEVNEHKTKNDWAHFVKRISDEMCPGAKKIVLVMDNFKTHDPSALYETFEPREAKRIWDRFEFIFTPKHGSWLNMAEIELHVLNGQCLNRHISTKERVEQEVAAWQRHRNNGQCTINWQFTTKESRIKLKRLYPSFND